MLISSARLARAPTSLPWLISLTTSSYAWGPIAAYKKSKNDESGNLAGKRDLGWSAWGEAEGIARHEFRKVFSYHAYKHMEVYLDCSLGQPRNHYETSFFYIKVLFEIRRHKSHYKPYGQS